MAKVSVWKLSDCRLADWSMLEASLLNATSWMLVGLEPNLAGCRPEASGLDVGWKLKGLMQRSSQVHQNQRTLDP